MEPTAPAPWYKSELFRWGVSIALGFALNWLASHGITPAPLPAAPVPGVLVPLGAATVGFVLTRWPV